MKNGNQDGSKKRPKWDHKSPGRRIFEILGRSGRRCFFDVFGDWKKSAQNPEKSAGGAKNKKKRAICWAARRNVRGCRGGKEGFRTPPGSARILARNLKPRILGPGKNLAGT